MDVNCQDKEWTARKWKKNKSTKSVFWAGGCKMLSWYRDYYRVCVRIVPYEYCNCRKKIGFLFGRLSQFSSDTIKTSEIFYCDIQFWFTVSERFLFTLDFFLCSSCCCCFLFIGLKQVSHGSICPVLNCVVGDNALWLYTINGHFWLTRTVPSSIAVGVIVVVINVSHVSQYHYLSINAGTAHLFP